MKGRELYITLGSFKEYDPMDAHCLISLKAQIKTVANLVPRIFSSPHPRGSEGRKTLVLAGHVSPFAPSGWVGEMKDPGNEVEAAAG